jgi:SAM-dependent methyltransferase
MQRLDYDTIAPLFDEPGRDHPLDPHLLAYFAEHPALAPAAARILDVGCGTGKQLAADRARFPDTLLVGVDRFAGMLRIARQRGPDIAWVQGDGAALPFPTDSFDYITNQFSYHHVGRTEQFFGEVYRVLQPGGRFVITNIDPWAMPGWNIYRYFPAAQERDHQDFLRVDRLVARLHGAGFVGVRAAWDRRVVRQDLREFLAYASTRHRTSQLLVISDDAHRAGIARIEQTLAAANGAPVPVDSEGCLITISADKPDAVY